eukprot:scaffold3058_cov134-Isochrysis_galbana.AAC.1
MRDFYHVGQAPAAEMHYHGVNTHGLGGYLYLSMLIVLVARHKQAGAGRAVWRPKLEPPLAL